jgi:hypothetical protein
MEPAVRSPRIKSAITAGRAQNGAFFGLPESPNSRQPTGIGRQRPCRTERNFLMQRLQAKNQPNRPQGSPETERGERHRRKSPQKRPIASRHRDLWFRRTGWWGQYGSNCQLPTQSSNRSPISQRKAGNGRLIRQRDRNRELTWMRGPVRAKPILGQSAPSSESMSRLRRAAT